MIIDRTKGWVLDLVAGEGSVLVLGQVCQR